ncbi:uncharacterized protein LOC143877670 isoform X2 [Tasmannia lanceolata]|uniref:uncharacterized protein LOC143877670 isoform X2 n=1 Tax=Tasmannia lanceolata TaxID=3420 RepID=UPI00406320D8
MEISISRCHVALPTREFHYEIGSSDTTYAGMGLKVLCEGDYPSFIPIKDAQSNLRSSNWFNLNEDIMLMAGEFHLNSNQRYTDSLKEFVKQTMLNHEEIFRRQVSELHRLYRIQQNIVNDLRWKEFETYTARTASPQTTPISLQKANRYIQSEEVTSTQAENGDMSNDYEGFYPKHHKDHKERTFNLQLPADEYICIMGTAIIKESNLHPCINERLEVKDFLGGKSVIDPPELRRDSETGEDTNKKGGVWRDLSDKDTCLYAQHVIDLEESVERVSDKEANTISLIDFEAPTTYVGYKHVAAQLINPSFLGRTRKGPACVPALNCTFAEHSESWQEWKRFDLNAGTSEGNGGSIVDMISPKQQCTSYEFENVDLNKDANLLSDACQYSQSGSAQASSQNSRLTENSWNCDGNGADPISLAYSVKDPTELHLNSKKEFSHNGVGELNCNSALSLSSTGLWKATNENVDLSLGHLDGFPRDDGGRDPSIATMSSKKEESHIYSSLGSTQLPQTDGELEARQVNSEKSEEDTVSSSRPESHSAIQGVISCPIEDKPVEYSKELPEDNNSTEKEKGSIKDLELSHYEKNILRHSNLCLSEDSGTSRLESPMTVTCSDKQDPIAETDVFPSLQEESPKSQEQNEHRQENMATTDITILNAAVSLIYISLEKSENSLNRSENAGPKNLATGKKSEQPQYSSESYESIALMLKESNDEECSTAAWPAEEKVTGMDSCSVRLRRGSRLRDFQKDVLPSLVSLSRHEICEDINMIGGVIQLNGLRKNGSRKTRPRNWCMPTRSWRRLYCIDR